MGSPNHAVLGIAEEDRAAIGSENAEDDARLGGDHAVAFRPFGDVVCGCDMHIGGMDLVECGQPVGFKPEPCCNACPVFANLVLVVIGAEADIQPLIDTFGHTAHPAEEAVPD